MELLCLYSPEKSIYFEDILQGFQEEQSLTEEEELPAERNDRTSLYGSDIYNHLKIRPRFLSDNYPFHLEKTGLALKEDQHDLRFIYIFLLLAANLRCLEKTARSCFTKDFESLAVYVLRVFLPAPFTVKAIGTVEDGNFPAITGSVLEKIEALAKEVHAIVLLEEKERDRLKTAGDGGLDIVAWRAFSDPASHIPLYLCQAGCSSSEEDMVKKQWEVGIERWKNTLSHIVPTPVMLTPVCYRDGVGKWPSPTEISTVFLDRIRIMELVSAGEYQSLRQQIDSSLQKILQILG